MFMMRKKTKIRKEFWPVNYPQRGQNDFPTIFREKQLFRIERFAVSFLLVRIVFENKRADILFLSLLVGWVCGLPSNRKVTKSF